MLINLKHLIAACDELGLDYSLKSESGNVVEVLGDQRLFFSNWSTPFNSHSFSNLVRDKGYTYELFHEHISMPRTITLLDPGVDGQYQEYVRYRSIENMVDTVGQQLHLPTIVKRNRG